MFRIKGLNSKSFEHLYDLSDEELALHGARRCVADRKPGFPDRIEVRDAEPGETLLLVNYVHQPANTPYRASHAIFVREGATETYDRINEVPEVMRVRPISLRAFDQEEPNGRRRPRRGRRSGKAYRAPLVRTESGLPAGPLRQARLLRSPHRTSLMSNGLPNVAKLEVRSWRLWALSLPTAQEVARCVTVLFGGVGPSRRTTWLSVTLFRSIPRPWNTGRIIGAKPPFKPKHVWAIRQQLKTAVRWTRSFGQFGGLAKVDSGLSHAASLMS